MAINRPSVAVYIGILLFFISCRQSLMATNNEGMKMIHFVYAREEENERERESDLRHVTSLVWAPHRREKEVGARVHLDHQGNRHRPGLGFFFCFVFLQIFPFTHTQHIKVFPSRRTKNYFENKKKKNSWNSSSTHRFSRTLTLSFWSRGKVNELLFQTLST